MEELSFKNSFQKSCEIIKIFFTQSSENNLRDKSIHVHKEQPRDQDEIIKMNYAYMSIISIY